MTDFSDLGKEDIQQVSQERLDQLQSVQIGDVLLLDLVDDIVHLVKRYGFGDVSLDQIRRQLVGLALECHADGFNEGVCK